MSVRKWIIPVTMPEYDLFFTVRPQRTPFDTTEHSIVWGAFMDAFFRHKESDKRAECARRMIKLMKRNEL